jgi:hypothetical protein
MGRYLNIDTVALILVASVTTFGISAANKDSPTTGSSMFRRGLLPPFRLAFY